MTPQTMPARHLKTLALAALLAGTALQAHAGFVLGSSVTGLATDNHFPATIFSGDALIGAGAEFTGIQDFTHATLTWSADFDADSVTVSLVTSQGLSVFGALPRETFEFTNIALTAGLQMSDLALVSVSNFDLGAVLFGTDSLTINFNTFSTHNDCCTASVTYAFRAAQPVPEPGSLTMAGLGVAAMAFMRRGRRRGVGALHERALAAGTSPP